VKHHLPAMALLVGMVAGLGFSIPLAHGDAKPITISVDEIKSGMKGYGLTVFKGTSPERFDVEVIDTLKNFRPGQDLILVKTPHPRLNVTKNVRGMSGSPIYLDGRLAGAYAYSWSTFQIEPVAGVTPIKPMLTELHRPIPPGFWPIDGTAPLPKRAMAHASVDENVSRAAGGATAWSGEPGAYDLEKHAEQIRERLSPSFDPKKPVVPATTPLLLGGVSDRTASLVSKLFGPLGFEPVQAGGGASIVDPNAPLHYTNGGTLTIQMARGDVSLTGLGTVTYVEGQKLCGFGHPMMEAGVTALPAAIGKVLWIFASDQHSSKIGEAVRPLGALVQDRQSAVIVDETIAPPTFPFTINVRGAEGAPKKDWNVEVAEERFMSPSLVASVLGSVIDATVNERRDVTWRLVTKLSVRGQSPIELEDFGVAVGGMPDAGEFARSKVVRAVGDVLNNPWELTHIGRIESVLTVDYTRDVLRVRGVDVLEPVVDAGQSAHLRVHLAPFAGPEITRVIEVKLPEELAGKEVDLEILPGYQVAPELAAPQTLGDLLRNSTKQSVLPKSLVVQYRIRSQGVAFKGHVADRLPPFAFDALRPATSDTGPDAFASYARVIVPLDRYIEGSDRTKVTVRQPLR